MFVILNKVINKSTCMLNNYVGFSNKMESKKIGIKFKQYWQVLTSIITRFVTNYALSVIY